MSAIKFVVLAGLFCASFWLALLATFTVIAAWIARNSDGDSEATSQTEWRYGPAGYGLYTFDGHRIDPHDPGDEED